jgi:hypothetical protein
MLKICGQCKLEKPIEEFHINKSRKDGHSVWCGDCNNKKTKAYHSTEKGSKYRKQYCKWYNKTQQGKKSRRKCVLKRQYGITLERYDEMFTKQNGVCAICGKPETMKNQYGLVSLSVDHNHTTNAVRKLLCHRCNSIIGMVCEDTNLLENIIRYLKD